MRLPLPRCSNDEELVSASGLVGGAYISATILAVAPVKTRYVKKWGLVSRWKALSLVLSVFTPSIFLLSLDSTCQGLHGPLWLFSATTVLS